MTSAPSSPFRAGSTVEDQLAYYKAQYEQLETELQEFQASSRELEVELEKDVEASEKRERKLKEQVESLSFGTEEWKTKYKQAKSEANTAQTNLQKEVTTLRDTSRMLQLKLRDIEVANDDYERQARNTTSSLEDIESKYNVSIERGVMLEEEIRAGEQEREILRIETQRLRDELSDLRIESEITAEKLRIAEITIERFHSPRTAPMYLRPARPNSFTSELSATTDSSPTTSTPPPSKSGASTTSEMPTPPSPPLSDVPTKPNVALKRTGVSTRKSLVPDANITPRPLFSSRPPRHSRGPSVTSASTSMTGNSHKMAPPPPRSSQVHADGPPRSESLHQIKGLIGRMQKIEERVHQVRSKLPPPSNTTPKGSPRTGSTLGSNLGSSVTVRSSRKRISTNHLATAKQDDEALEGRSTSRHVSRLSFGLLPPAHTSDNAGTSSSRPSSRASNASQSAANPFMRPASRSSMGGARTPLGSYSSQTSTADRRPRSSIGGNYGAVHGTRHGHSASVSEEHDAEADSATPTARRTTIDRTGIPTPSSKRQSGGFSNNHAVGRRPSLGFGLQQNPGDMAPPADRRRKMSDVGETF